VKVTIRGPESLIAKHGLLVKVLEANTDGLPSASVVVLAFQDSAVMLVRPPFTSSLV
jgi:hypothetical protein